VLPLVHENFSESRKSSGIGLGGSRHVMFVGQVGVSDRGGVGTKYRDVERWKGREDCKSRMEDVSGWRRDCGGIKDVVDAFWNDFST
jgi:hypothetical protein